MSTDIEQVKHDLLAILQDQSVSDKEPIKQIISAQLQTLELIQELDRRIVLLAQKNSPRPR